MDEPAVILVKGKVVRERIRLVSLIAILAAVTALPFGRVMAQNKGPKDARLVAAAVQSFYDQTKDITASFYQTYVNKIYKRTDRAKGKVVFEKPGKMRWDYELPNGKVIVSDGVSIKVYEPGDQGEAGQVIEQSLKEAELPQALSFLMGTGRLENAFTFKLLDAEREGFPAGRVLELRPRTPSPHYDRVVFYVESDRRLLGLVRRVLIIDHSGNRNRFDFTKLEFNKRVSSSLFRWNPPTGTRVIKP